MIRSILNWLDLPNWRDLPGGGLVSEVISDNPSGKVSGTNFYAFNAFLLSAAIIVHREFVAKDGLSETMFFGFLGVWVGAKLGSKWMRTAGGSSEVPEIK